MNETIPTIQSIESGGSAHKDRFTRLVVICILTLLLGCASNCSASETSLVNWVPAGLPAAPTNGPALCRGFYLTPEQGKAVLDAALAELERWRSKSY